MRKSLLKMLKHSYKERKKIIFFVKKERKEIIMKIKTIKSIWFTKKDHDIFIENLKEINISLQQIANKYKVSKTYIHHIVSGKKAVPKEMFSYMLGILQLDIDKNKKSV